MVRVPASIVDRLAILGGVASLLYGVSMLSVPGAWMLAGGLLIVGAIWRKL